MSGEWIAIAGLAGTVVAAATSSYVAWREWQRRETVRLVWTVDPAPAERNSSPKVRVSVLQDGTATLVDATLKDEKTELGSLDFLNEWDSSDRPLKLTLAPSELSDPDAYVILSFRERGKGGTRQLRRMHLVTRLVEKRTRQAKWARDKRSILRDPQQ